MISSNYSTMNDLSQRKIEGKVELFSGSTSLNTFLPSDKLQEIVIARTSEKGKFFGFGICQQATVKIVDKTGSLLVSKGNSIHTSFRANSTSAYTRVCPTFYVKDVKHDEKTNIYTITSYDALDGATAHVISELGLTPPYTLKTVVERISSFLGLSVNITDSAFDTSYENGANFNGDETLRVVLNAIAEVTQTIYYIDHRNNLVFKRLDRTGDSVLTINKKDYFELTTALPITITDIMHVTELGDNVVVGTAAGACQYVRDNPFWNTREDVAELLTNSLARITGLTIVPHSLKWRGNFLTEIGDKIDLEAKDGSLVAAYLLDDTLTYNGGMTETSAWEYTPDSERVTAGNPATIGEKISQTFARVDKVNKQITLQASEIAETKESVGALRVSTEEVSASVNSVEQKIIDVEGKLEDGTDVTNARIDSLAKDVSLKLDKQGVQIEVESILTEGVEKVTTASKKYTFDDSGLNISSSDSEISTKVTEDGMRIYRYSQEVLSVNNQGVKAADLHAVTFLLIGENSRLEDRGNRTACFWIGKAGG